MNVKVMLQTGDISGVYKAFVVNLSYS